MNLSVLSKKVVTVICFAIIVISGIYRCPFKLIFGVDCPGCGMTRAFISALKLDFKAAFRYHPLFWLFGIETAYVLLINIAPRIRRNKNAELVIGIVSLFLLLIVWLARR